MLQRADLVLTYTGPDALVSVVEHLEAIAPVGGHRMPPGTTSWYPWCANTPWRS